MRIPVSDGFFPPSVIFFQTFRMSFYFFGLGEAKVASLCLLHNDTGNFALMLLLDKGLVQQMLVLYAECNACGSRFSIPPSTLRFHLNGDIGGSP